MQTLLSIGLIQLLAVISPGPSFLITARMAVSRSRLDGVKVALGLGAGTVIWASAALLGLHLLFLNVAWLYLAVKLFGALFMIFIAFQIIRHSADPIIFDAPTTEKVLHPFLQGFMTQISNPKVVVFFGSIFVALMPNDMPPWMIVALIAVVSFNEVWWYSFVALFFGLRPVKSFYIRLKKSLDRITGVFLGLVGLRLIWSALSE